MTKELTQDDKNKLLQQAQASCDSKGIDRFLDNPIPGLVLMPNPIYQACVAKEYDNAVKKLDKPVVQWIQDNGGIAAITNTLATTFNQIQAGKNNASGTNPNGVDPALSGKGTSPLIWLGVFALVVLVIIFLVFAFKKEGQPSQTNG